MPCTDTAFDRRLAVNRQPGVPWTLCRGLHVPALSLLLVLLTGCATRPPSAPGTEGVAVRPAAGAPGPGPATPTVPPAGARPGLSPALPMARARNWDEYRAAAARRMVAAHPGITYMGKPPEPLLAIPVLEIELQADGSVRDVRVLRHPSQARDTTQLAIDAVRRAGPFGPVAHLPRPWRFTEAFLFDDDRRFKPRSLD